MADTWELLAEGAEVLAVHAALLPNGKVLYFGGSEHDERSTSVDATRLWNPATRQVERATFLSRDPFHLLDPPDDLFCCGHCLLPTGDLLVAGGTGKYDKDAPPVHADVHHFTGISSVNVFDWGKAGWFYANGMSEGRWYPTVITLPDGRVLAMSGHGSETASPHENTRPEIFDPATGEWSAPFATIPPLEVTGGDFWFGTHVIPMVYYPRLHVLPSGQIFSSTPLRAGGKRMTRSVELTNRSLITLADPPPGSQDIKQMEHVYSRSAFASVLLPLKPPHYGARILICGEKQPLFFEPNNAHLGWRNAGSQRSYPMRAYLNAIILPDATVLVVGGAQSEKGPFGSFGSEKGGEDSDAIFSAEQYNPATNSWQTLSVSPNQIARVYHSVALLLPDGRVWMAGSNHDSQRNRGGVREDHPEKGDARELRMEVYSPPYLFAKDAAGNDILDAEGNPVPAVRPEIQWTRAGCSYDQEFPIETAKPNRVRTVALIRCSSATHAFNPDQRYIELVVHNAKTTLESLTVSGPPTPQIAPPGYYLLFILNEAGTPSVGRFFRVSAEYPIIEGFEGKEKPGLTYDFGTMKPGETRKALIQFKNVGSGQLKVRLDELSGSFLDKDVPPGLFGEPGHPKNTEFVLSPESANPGFYAELKVVFTPAELGMYTGSLWMLTNAPDAAGISLALRANVEGLRLEISPQGAHGGRLDFGAVPVGTTKTLKITVRNVGNVNAYVSDMILTDEVPNGQFYVPPVIADRAIPVGQVRTFLLTYIPTVVAGTSATVTLMVESSTASPVHREQYPIDLVGVGTGPSIVFNPTSLTFADQVIRTSSPAQTVTLTNTGSAPLTISSISVGHDFSQVNTCGTSLAEGKSCDISVSFHPGHAGPINDILSIDSNAVGGVEPVVLTGTGLAEPVVVLSSTHLNFGDQPVGTGGAGQTITLMNDGVAPLAISGVNLTGTNQHDFVKIADSCSGATIAPEGSCTVSVQFNPGTTGGRAADLTFTDNAAGSPHRVSLSGTGIAAPARTLNPTILTFDSQPRGTRSAPRLVTLTNNGSTALKVSNVQVTGANAQDFAMTSDRCSGATITPGNSCDVEVNFSPTVVGGRAAGLTFTDDAPGSPQTIPLGGTGTGAVVSIEPGSLVFPELPVGARSDWQEVTIRNSGNASLIITTILPSGDFKIRTSCVTTLPPGRSCPIQVFFAPQGAGVRTGEVTVVDNAEGSPHRVPLQGTGIVPLATLSPSTLTFGSQPVGSNSTPQTVTLTNTGLAVLTINTIHLTGANSGDFIKVTDSCTGPFLFPGASCSVSVSFTPTATGRRDGSLTFEDNASDSPQNVPLTGSGS